MFLFFYLQKYNFDLNYQQSYNKKLNSTKLIIIVQNIVYFNIVVLIKHYYKNKIRRLFYYIKKYK